MELQQQKSNLESQIECHEATVYLLKKYPLWAAIVPLLEEGKSVNKIVKATGLSRLKVTRTIKQVEKLDFPFIYEMSLDFVRHREFYELQEALQGRDPEDPETQAMIAQWIHLAPPEFKKQIDSEAIEKGLVPRASHYTEDGAPMYSVETIANHFGVSQEEAELKLRELSKGYPDDISLVGPDNLTPVQ